MATRKRARTKSHTAGSRFFASRAPTQDNDGASPHALQRAPGCAGGDVSRPQRVSRGMRDGTPTLICSDC